MTCSSRCRVVAILATSACALTAGAGDRARTHNVRGHVRVTVRVVSSGYELIRELVVGPWPELSMRFGGRPRCRVTASPWLRSRSSGRKRSVMERLRRCGSDIDGFEPAHAPQCGSPVRYRTP